MSTIRTVTSVVDGQPVTGSTTISSTNPTRPSEVVAEVSLADASVFVGAAESAEEGAGQLGRRSPPRYEAARSRTSVD